MYFSARALRALILAAAFLVATLFVLAGPTHKATSQVNLKSGERLIQVDDACVLISSGDDDLLAVGPKCPDKSDQGSQRPHTSPPEDAPSANDPPATTIPGPGGSTEDPTGATTGTTDADPLQGGTTRPETGDYEKVTVVRAVDGDTLEISPTANGTDTVRLIGLDTPEMATDEAAVPEPYAEEAKKFTADSLEGKEVYLEYDEDLKDDYGRLLAYVYLEDPSTAGTDKEGQDSNLFNETLLREGYAKLFTVEPNVRYEDRLAAAEAKARDEGIGVWGLKDPNSTTTGTTSGPDTGATTTSLEPLAAPQAGRTDLGSTALDSTTQALDPEVLQGGTTVEDLSRLEGKEPGATPPMMTGGTTPGDITAGGTTTGGTTMQGPGQTGSSFDPSALRKEATRLADESLNPGADQPSVEQTGPTPQPAQDTPADTPADTPDISQTPAEVPAPPITEPPVSTLPDTGGLNPWVIGAVVYVSALGVVLVFEKQLRAGLARLGRTENTRRQSNDEEGR